jgi:hypothetical protein
MSSLYVAAATVSRQKTQSDDLYAVLLLSLFGLLLSLVVLPLAPTEVSTALLAMLQ